MRIKDKIASDVLDALAEFGIRPKKKDYLDVECMIADTIGKSLAKWLNYDADLSEFRQR